MSLHNQIIADAETVFYNKKDIAESAIYISPSGSETEITVVCDGEQVADKETNSGKIQVRLSQFAIKVSEVEKPLINGTIVYKLESWPIVGISESDFAESVVLCELPVGSMQGRGGTYSQRINGQSYRR